MADFFSNFKSSTPDRQLLGEVTNHPVTLVRWEEINSLANYDGTIKDNEPGYADSTPQVLGIFMSTEGAGTLVYRFNGCGYYKMHELTKKQIESGKIFEVDGYACIKKSDGRFYRIESPQKTKDCYSILSEMFAAFGLPAGTGIEGLDQIVADRAVALITTKQTMYDGRPQIKIKRFRKAVKVNG
jgi:hypothetical protein